MEPKRLTRSNFDKKIAGVCGGLAKYFDLDPTIVRVAYALLVLLSGIFPLVIFYVICMFVMPEDGKYLNQ